MSIGEKIKSAREAANMTQEELGRRCGTTKQSIYKYENGIVTNIPLDRIEKIASVTGVSALSLMEWENNKPIAIFRTTPEEQRIIELYRLAPSGDQIAINSILDKYAPPSLTQTEQVG